MRTVLVASVAGVICASTGYAFAVTRPADPVGGAIKQAGGMCLDVAQSGTRDGTKVQIFDCNGTPAQSWATGTNDSIQALGKCLDVAFSGTANGTRVQLWRCNGTAAQRWQRTGDTLINPRSAKCLAVAGTQAVRGAAVQIQACNGSAGQAWNTSTTPTAAPTTPPTASPTKPPTTPPTTSPTKPPTTSPTKPPTTSPTKPPTNPVSVAIKADSSRAPDLANWLNAEVEIIKEWYQKIAALLPTDGYTPPKNISVTIDPGYSGVAYTSGTSIVASASYTRSHQNDTGFLVHEAVHVIQQNKNGPGWFIEGSADYVRYFFYEPGKISAPSKNSDYTDGYAVSAWFLNYVATHYDKDIVAKVMDASRRGVYKDSLWTQYTGKNLDRLWAETPKR